MALVIVEWVFYFEGCVSVLDYSGLDCLNFDIGAVVCVALSCCVCYKMLGTSGSGFLGVMLSDFFSLVGPHL